jgi:hypothetical protein
MTEPTPNFSGNPELRHITEAPVQGGDTRTPEEINAEAQRIADAERAAEAQADTQHGRRANRPGGMSRGAKVALGVAGGVIVAGAVTGIAAGAGAFNSDDEGNQGGTGTGEGTDGGNGGIEGNTITIELSPESLAGLSAEQIAETFTIPTVDAEGNPTSAGDAVETFEHNFEGLLNAGTTDAEFEPYANTPGGEYEGALTGKYDAPALGAMLYDPSAGEWISVNHSTDLSLSMTARVLETDEPFMQGVEITPAEGADLEAPAAGTEIPVTIEFKSNAEELGLIDFYAGTSQQIDGIDRSANYTLKFVDVDGALKAVLVLV